MKNLSDVTSEVKNMYYLTLHNTAIHYPAKFVGNLVGTRSCRRCFGLLKEHLREQLGGLFSERIGQQDLGELTTAGVSLSSLEG